MDDRGVGESGGTVSAKDTSADFATDISAAVNYLKQRSDLSKSEIGLIGHSEGGMIASILAAQRDDLAFNIMLAGPGIPIYQLMAEQNYLLQKASGFFDEGYLKNKRIMLEKLYLMLAKLELEQPINEEIKAQLLEAIVDDEITNKTQQDAQMKAQLKHLESGWFRYFMAFDPGNYLHKSKTPILALYGETDLQVAAKSNSLGLKKILEASQHTDYLIKELENHNHLFQHSETGYIQEYGQLEETFSEQALKIIVEWLDKRFQKK